jgi:hypothetical protein
MNQLTAAQIKKLIHGQKAVCIYVNDKDHGEVTWSCSLPEMCYLKATLDKTIHDIMSGEISMNGKAQRPVPDPNGNTNEC